MTSENLFRKAASSTPSRARHVVRICLRKTHNLFRHNSIYRWTDDLLYTIKRYRHTFGNWPNLFHPTTFNEHLNFKKLFDRRSILTKLADKYAVRQYVQKRVGKEYLTHLYLVASRPEMIDFSLLPDRFVIKASHGSGWNVIVTDKSQIDEPNLRNQLDHWLSQNYYERGREWCYRDIEPCLLVEEFLTGDHGGAPWDYKFFCFDGEAKFIQVDIDRFQKHSRNIYDRQWHLLDVRYHHQNSDKIVGVPQCLESMIEVAETLSDGLDFVRVDLFNIRNRVYFGELTHYPGNGFEKFHPSHFDSVFGAYWPDEAMYEVTGF